MGKDKKPKKSRDEKEKFDDGESISSANGIKVGNSLKDDLKDDKSIKNSKEKSTPSAPTNFSDEESEVEIITLEQQGKKKRKTKQKKANFSLLEIEGENDSVVNSDDERNSKEQSESSEITETKSKSKPAKKSKKKERKKKDEDEEDIDKMLEELALEASGKVPVKSDSVEAVKPVSKPEEETAEAAPAEKPKKSKKKKTEEKAADVTEDTEKDQNMEEESATVKSAAQKKKEKKEREKLKKQAQFESGSKKKPDSKLKEESPVPEQAEDQVADEKKDDEEEGDSKKKKKKKKNEEEEKKDKKRPGKKTIAAMQEALKKVKEEEERLRLEEEAKLKAAEEAERLRLEKLRLEQERKEKKKQKEKEKRERLRAEGKLLTKSQKQNRARMEATLAALREQGVEVPQIGEKKEPRPRLGDRKKMPKKKSTSQEPTSEVPETEEMVIDNKEDSPQPVEEIPEPPPAPPVEEEDVKDAWDDTSSEEDEDDRSQPEVKKVEIVTSKRANKSDSDEESSGSEDSSDEEESDSDDDSYSSSDSQGDGNVSTLEKVQNRIQKRRELAESNRSMDKLRSPVVCVLGHVDTGKTKILDKIRSSNVQDHEAGGITQQIGATMVPEDALREQCKMVKGFTEMELKVPGLLIIDTPGHESFSNLRSRGSSLCDIAILVVDINHGLEPQTIESINMLKQRKTPFIVALNKIDRVYEWKSMKNKDVQDIIKGQSRSTKQFFEDRVKQIILEFANQSLNAVLCYENSDPRSYISMVPTSAVTGEGMGNLMGLIVELTQSMMAKRLMFSEELQATILEVKAISGLGHTMDSILVNGRLKEGDTIVFAGYDGPVCSQIRSLLMPQPLKELRVKTQFIEHREVEGAQGVKICGKDLDKAIAGLPLLVPKRPDETKVLMDEVAATFRDTMNSIKVTGTGVYVQTSTLGSLEALMEFLSESKIPVSGVRIGPVTKKDVMKASAMLEHDPTYAVILAFDVRIEREAQELADSLNIKIFHANIIYHLFDAFVNYRAEIKEKNREMFKSEAVFPCKLKILPQFVFNSRDPIVVGVSVEAGVLKDGTPLCVPSKEERMDGSKNATTEEAQGNSHDDTDKGLLASYEKSLESGTNSSDSDSDFEYTCEICDKTFSGPKPLRQHERGAKHMKQKRKKETEKEMLKRLEDHSEDEDLDRPIFAVCKTCDKQFVGPESFNQHLIGRNHKKRVAASKLLDQLRDDDGHISLEKLKQREKERKKMTKKTLIIGNRTFGHDEPHKSGSKSELLDQLEEGNKQVQQEAENSMEQEACFSVVGHTESYNSEDSSDDERFAENEEFQCTDCQKAFSGVNPWYQHLTSKTHKKTLKQKRLLEKLVNDEATPPPGGLKDKSFLKEDGDVLVCHLCHTSFTGPESASTHLKSKGHAKKLEKQEYKKKLKERKREAEGKDKTHLETSSATEDQPFTEVEGKEDIENQDLKIVAEINEYLSQESAEITKENESDAHKISSTGTSENKTKDAIKSDSK